MVRLSYELRNTIADKLYNAGYRKVDEERFNEYMEVLKILHESEPNPDVISIANILSLIWNCKTEKQIFQDFSERLKEYARACKASGYDGIGENDIDELLKEFTK